MGLALRSSALALSLGALVVSGGCGSGPGTQMDGSRATVKQDGNSLPASASAAARYADRPVAGFVRRFVETAGYEIAGDTGSAWIARGGGASFFIWASEKPPEAFLAAGNWSLAFRDSETSIYAVQDQEMWWSTGEHVILIRPGPRGDAVLPTMSAVVSLANESRTSPRALTRPVDHESTWLGGGGSTHPGTPGGDDSWSGGRLSTSAGGFESCLRRCILL
jgi:hypothetical protein